MMVIPVAVSVIHCANIHDDVAFLNEKVEDYGSGKAVACYCISRASYPTSSKSGFLVLKIKVFEDGR
jgi:hypothetical protein